LLTAQAEAARILVEAVDSWSVKLPTLDDLIKTTSGQTLNEVLERGANMTTKWMVLSLKKIVEEEDAGDDGAGKKDKDADDEDDPREWLNLYKSNKLAEAIELLTKRLAKNPRRPAAARIYNNLGYMKYDLKDHVEAARRDMERARDLHFFELPLTLLNLGVVAIDNGAFADAIQTIEDALLLTVGRESIDASFLRLRLLGGHLMFAQREKWEQHPANVLEAAYVNLGYALAREGDHDAARDVLEEGLELVPSSSHLRHALARLHLSQRRAQLADPLYAQLSDMLLSDSALAGEVRAYRRVGGRRSVKG
jgi:tetratricopeptide (TPR) repeat protein